MEVVKFAENRSHWSDLRRSLRLVFVQSVLARQKRNQQGLQFLHER